MEVNKAQSKKRLIMDKNFKNELYKWTYEKIKSNPKKFGGDFSNSLIMYEYLKEFYADNYVLEISPNVPENHPVRKLILAAVMCIDMVLKE